MSKPKDPPPCKRYREAFMLVEVNGLTTEEAGAQLGIKPKSVVDMCSKVRTWMQRHGGHWSRIKENARRIEIVRELYAARLEHQWKLVMNAWYLSTQPHKRVKAVYDKEEQVERSEVIRSSQTGNVRYLLQAARVLEKICKLREPELSPEEKVNATLIERRTELTELLRLYGPGTRPETSGGAAVGEDAAAQSPGTARAA
jgi:hypothetical protein